MTVSGGCQCGAVRYTIRAERLAGYACHCRECQKQSASAFGVSVPVREEHFELTGEVRVWSRPTDSGGVTDCHFCPKCGSRLYHAGRAGREWITVKGGSLDDPSAVEFVANIWTRRKAPWIELREDLPAWDTQPQTIEEWKDLLGWDA
ncbi:MAG: GFA family protein [Pseudomonadota bacterium]